MEETKVVTTSVVATGQTVPFAVTCESSWVTSR